MTWDQANNLYGCMTIAAETIGVIVSIWAFMVMQSASAQLATGEWEREETLSEQYAAQNAWRM
jgi:hypothetical protein